MNILEDIIKEKKNEIQSISVEQNHDVFIHRSLLKKLSENKLHLIAEVKKASPSKGVIYADFNHIKLAKTFENNGASCISVLTDEKYFQGNKRFLTEIKKVTNIPILRKDFIIHPIQVKESRAIGADVMLLILDILSVNQANELIHAATEENLDVLLEIHSQESLEKLALIKKKPIVGVNNRDLTTFECDLNRVITMGNDIKTMDPTIKRIAESGYFSPEQMNNLVNNNINGVLIGEGLSKNKKLMEWFNNEN